jgi:hypothetical protein
MGKKNHCSLFIINDSNQIFSSGAPANHSSRPTIEKTCTSVHRSTPIYYLQHSHNASTTGSPHQQQQISGLQ